MANHVHYKAIRDCYIVTNVVGPPTGPSRTMKEGTVFCSDDTVSTVILEGRTLAYRPVLGEDSTVEGHVFVGATLKTQPKVD